MEFKELSGYMLVFSIVAFLAFGYLLYGLLQEKKHFLHLYPWLMRASLPKMTYFLAFWALSFAFLACFWIWFWVDTQEQEKEWIDISIILDVSKSMNTKDITDGWNQISRLDSAKKAIASFLAHHPNDRVWLTIFSGEASSVVPLTTDHSLFLTLLDGVDYRNLSKQGTNFSQAIDVWSSHFATWSESKAVILISDGGDEMIDINTIKALKTKYSTLSYFVLGLGSKDGGYIPDGVDIFWSVQYVHYQWAPVLSKRNDSTLSQIASALDASYSEIDDLARIETTLEKLKKWSIHGKSLTKTKDQSRNIIFFAVFLLLFSAFFTEWKHFMTYLTLKLWKQNTL